MDATAALLAERDVLLNVCRKLDLAQWRTPSALPGWQVRDVVAHLGATCRDAFGPRLANLLSGKDIETANNAAVHRRRKHTPAEVLTEYETWSGRFAAVFGATGNTPLGAVPLRLAELGWYPMSLLNSVLVFDHHLHLRHDIAPALGLELPPTDEARMNAVLEWMLAGLEQMNRSAMRWVDRPVALTLNGPGAGTWRVSPRGNGRLRVEFGRADGAVAHITGSTLEFPVWATARKPWPEHDITIKGDHEYGARFLDAVNII